MFQVITWSDDGDPETARLGVDWVNLAQERDRCWAAVITLVNPWVPWNAGNFFNSRGTLPGKWRNLWRNDVSNTLLFEWRESSCMGIVPGLQDVRCLLRCCCRFRFSGMLHGFVRFVSSSRRFDWSYCRHFQGHAVKEGMNGLRSFETFLTAYETTQCNMIEDLNLHLPFHKPRLVIVC
jgi:hypothetical protein